MACLGCAWAPTSPLHSRPLRQRHHRPALPARVAPARATLRGEPSRGIADAAAGTGLEVRDGEEVNKAIVGFYDNSATAWERLFGNHMHHGFYEPGATPSLSDHRPALSRMVEESLALAGVSDDPLEKPKRIVDVGCGIGGGTVYLAKTLGVQCDGVNISSVQIAKARAHAVAEGLDDKVTFHVADAAKQPFPDGHFDLVWCMETAEHVPNKRKFMKELVRVAAPGATIVITGLFHRELLPGEDSLRPDEQKVLRKISDAFHHGSWFSCADYVEVAKSLSLQDIKTADWSDNISPFWPSVISSFLSWEGIGLILQGGWTVIYSIIMAPTMIEAFEKKVIKYQIITCQKPR
uniref:Putative tocopherol O-methyltransferase, chloroplastic n=1 Tax=Anthurium amnicola TaxID=1678845 RepID=A0A1D1YPZ6_9ARAE